MGIKHNFVSSKLDDADTTKVCPTNWNDDHTIDGDTSLGVIGVINVKDFGAEGDGVTDDTASIQAAIAAAFVVNLSSASGEDPAIGGQKILYLPAGVYKITSPLSLLGTYGAAMLGAGRLSTRIKNTTGGNCIATNGCAYSTFRDFALESAGGVCFDLDWDGLTYISLQSNTFENILFQNVAIGFTSYGVRIGQTAMGSENTFINCYWSDCDFGLITKNFNALQNQVVGGNFAGGDFGIYVDSGSVPVVSNVGFQNTSTFDIQIENSANDTMTITGCRTESQHFVHTATQPVVMGGCTMTNATSGTLLESTGGLIPYCTISSCISVAGKLRSVYGTIDNSQIGRDDWADGNCTFWVRNLTYGKTILGQGTGTLTFRPEGIFTLNKWDTFGPVNVKDYGAQGDGSTDDTAAVQAAITAACDHYTNALFFPAGVYNITDTLTIWEPIRVFGVGKRSNTALGSVLSFDHNNTNCIEIDVSATYDEGLVFEDLTFIGVDQGQLQHCFAAVSGSTMSQGGLSRVQFNGFTGNVLYFPSTAGVATYYQSLSMVDVSCANCGGFLSSGAVTTGLIMTHLYMRNINVEDPINKTIANQYAFFDFQYVREIQAQNIVYEPGNANTYVFSLAGNLASSFYGMHIEAAPANVFLFSNSPSGFEVQNVTKLGGIWSSGHTDAFIKFAAGCDHTHVLVEDFNIYAQTLAADLYTNAGGTDNKVIVLSGPDGDMYVEGDVQIVNGVLQFENFSTGLFEDSSNLGLFGGSSFFPSTDGSGHLGINGKRWQSLRLKGATFVNLPGSPELGAVACITDSNTAVWGATIAGSGGNSVLAFYNGTNWTVMGK